jgi:hypothetical protein
MNDTLRAYFITLALFAPAALMAQDPANWRRLYSPDMVCMPLEDFHTVAAKRAVADQLSRERAWVLLQQKGAIENLQRQVRLCDENIDDLNTVMDLQEGRLAECQDANIQLQTKLAKARQWSTVGKVSVALVGIAVVGYTVGQIAP